MGDDLSGCLSDRSAVFDGRFPATTQAVREALRQVVARLPATVRGTVELVLAEALNNVVEHAYAQVARGDIRLRVDVRRDGVLCRIADDGSAMAGGVLPRDPTGPVAVDPADPAEGGFGWFLIHQLTDDLRYDRTRGGNLLTFRVPAEGVD